MYLRKRHIIILGLLMSATYLMSQSASFGNTFIHNDGESVIFGLHDFDKTSAGSLPGVIGTQRTETPSYGILGWSDESPGWKSIGDDSYVDGYVRKYGDQSFVFPIGDNGSYRPIAISGADSTIAAYYDANPASAVTSTVYGGDYGPLPQGGPFPQAQSEEIILNVSELEYWDIDGTQPTTITLTWDIFSDIEGISNDDLERLTIVGWDGEKWVLIPSEIDLLYLNESRSRPLYNGGISNKTQGSITTRDEIIPDDFLAYTFGSFASGTIGDLVWEDMDRNGIQDLGEPGIPDVEIELIDFNTDQVLQTTTTDENGRYQFIGVNPGIYYLRFIPANTFAPTLPNQGIQALNSDLTFQGETAPFQLDLDESLLNIDGGFYQTGAIGDIVWIDNNNDGIQNSDEVGAAEVRVELLSDDQEIIAAHITNADGSYSFTNLPPDVYIIRVIPPVGHGIGPFKATTDEEVDSDIDPISGMSDPIALISGQIIENIDAAISNECAYVAELDIISPECGTSNGSIQAIIDGDTGPYNYIWSTGDTTSFLENVDTGFYSLLITDSENCSRGFNIEVNYEGECSMICANLDLHVLLEGPYNHGEQLMNRSLNENGYLPGQRPVSFLGTYTEAGHPYEVSPWFQTMDHGRTFESNSIAENNLYYDDDIVDWVLVSLRENKDIEYEACTRPGLLHQDGRISFLDDDCCLVDPTKSYYVVVEHKNHLIVMTPHRISVDADQKIAFDFRSNQSFIELFGAGQKEIAPGLYAMFAGNGDVNYESVSVTDINSNDLSAWTKENGANSSYYYNDYDLSGDVNSHDKSFYLPNNGVFTDVPKGGN